MGLFFLALLNVGAIALAFQAFRTRDQAELHTIRQFAKLLLVMALPIALLGAAVTFVETDGPEGASSNGPLLLGVFALPILLCVSTLVRTRGTRPPSKSADPGSGGPGA